MPLRRVQGSRNDHKGYQYRTRVWVPKSVSHRYGQGGEPLPLGRANDIVLADMPDMLAVDPPSSSSSGPGFPILRHYFGQFLTLSEDSPQLVGNSLSL